MAARLFVAPAASGKSAWSIQYAQAAAQNLQRTPIIVVPTPLQARSLRTRLARAGGALGVNVWLLHELYVAILREAAVTYVELAEPVQFRLIRAVVDRCIEQGVVSYYASLRERAGFIRVLQQFIGEMKSAGITPEALAKAFDEAASPPRLTELAAIYTAYQQVLRDNQWTDRAGLAWLAAATLASRELSLPERWSPLIFDGFDNFTNIQLDILGALAARPLDLVVTLTGDAAGLRGERPVRTAHGRFATSAGRLAATLNIQPEPLPVQPAKPVSPLAHLAENLFQPHREQRDPAGTLVLMEASNRATEVRAALRWLKERLVHDGYSPGDVALLARDMSAYRDIIVQIASEFGMPVRLHDGMPLRGNPAVAGLLELLQLMVPNARSNQPALPRRRVIEAWRSPYFSWGGWDEDGTPDVTAPAIAAGDAERLERVALQGRVIGGLDQWLEAFTILVERKTEDDRDEEATSAALAITGTDAGVLMEKFRRFVQVLSPPAGEQTMRDFVCWLEELIGPDPADASVAQVQTATPTAPARGSFSLEMVAQIHNGNTATRDIAALRALKDVLRGLVWAEEAVASATRRPRLLDFAGFYSELAGAIDAAEYHPPLEQSGVLLAANTVEVRGVPFRAIAVLGLAEGELPQRIAEDPFLRDADRKLLQRAGMAIEFSTLSAETEYFYETVTRARDQLLLVRPRLADNGAEWEPSPYWEEVRTLLPAQPVSVAGEAVLGVSQAASVAELVENLTRDPHPTALAWLSQYRPGRWEHLQHASELLRQRRQRHATPYDGDLSALQAIFTGHFGPDYRWSASRLEKYRTCGFFFLTDSVYRLAPREEPQEGLDVAQLGTIYHRIFEQIYRAVQDCTDLNQLLDALSRVAGAILDEAPRREGFRETAWWKATRDEIIETVRRCLEALHDAAGRFVPIAYEQRFGDDIPLTVEQDDDYFCLHGVIDRVDRDPISGQVRVIDYKTGSTGFTDRDLDAGHKIQLPLYALAAQESLRLGAVVDGFYWQIRKAEASELRLAGFQNGVADAIAVAVKHAWEAIHGVREGRFPPTPPAAGCPSYCPAAAFCWHYRAGYQQGTR